MECVNLDPFFHKLKSINCHFVFKKKKLSGNSQISVPRQAKRIIPGRRMQLRSAPWPVGIDFGFQLSRSGKKQLAFSSMGRVPFPLFEKPGKQKVMIDD